MFKYTTLNILLSMGVLQMIIKSVHIDKFRAIENMDFDLGSKLTAIVGHNGTMKTTVLGVFGQKFIQYSTDQELEYYF